MKALSTPPSSARRPERSRLARAPQIAGTALAIAIAAQAADIAVTISRDLGVLPAAGPAAAREQVAGRASPLTALNALMAAHLFGQAPLETAGSALSSGASSPPLVLTGVFATRDPAEGLAILGTSAASTQVFHTGSQVGPGTTLAEVYPERVVLLRGAERLILTLPRSGTLPGIETARIRTRPPEPQRELASAGTSGMALEPPPGSFKPPPMSDAGTLMHAFSMRPVAINGQRGVRIMGTGINSNTLAALGLAPGDVILQINGMAVGGKGTPNLAQALKSGSATLVVDRGGDATSVTIDPSAAASAAADYRQAIPDP